MNGKSTKTVGRGKSRPVVRNGSQTAASGKAARPASPALTEAVRALTAEVNTLQERLTQMEAR